MWIAIYLDNVLLQKWQRVIGPMWEYVYTDWLFLTTTGTHAVKMVIDPDNLISETTKADNVFELNYTWSPPTLTFSGRITFWDMNPPASPDHGAGNILVGLYDWDVGGATLLASTTATWDGFYALGPVNNKETDGDGGQQDVFFRVSANNGSALVCPASGSPSYSYDTQVEQNKRSGTYARDISIPQGSGGPFYVADAVLRARSKWIELGNTDPGTAKVILSNAVRTEYHTDTIFVSSAAIDSLQYPDTYENTVIWHEYGHRLESLCGFLCGESNPTSHSWNVPSTLKTAGTEGFAHFFSGLVGGPEIVNKWNSFQSSYKRNLENGEFGTNGYTFSANNGGKLVEGAVAGTLWDIYDSPSDDYSWWNGSSGVGFRDGIGDTLADGASNILSVLKQRYVSLHHPQDITEFWAAWFAPTSCGHSKAMEDIYYEHGMTCCRGMRGNVDGDANDQVDVSDMQFLIDYLFNNSTPPPCREEANVDGDSQGVVDQSDLLALIDFLFNHGTIPNCP